MLREGINNAVGHKHSHMRAIFKHLSLRLRDASYITVCAFRL